MTLAGAPGKTLAEDINKAAARPAHAKTPLPFPCSYQPSQPDGHLCGDARSRGQLSKRMSGGMQIFVKTPPQHHLSSLPTYMALTASLARARVEAGRGGDKVRGTPKRRIKCVLSRNG